MSNNRFKKTNDYYFYNALWFMIVTSTSVGYGDIVATTSLGRLVFLSLSLVRSRSLFLALSLALALGLARALSLALALSRARYLSLSLSISDCCLDSRETWGAGVKTQKKK